MDREDHIIKIMIAVLSLTVLVLKCQNYTLTFPMLGLDQVLLIGRKHLGINLRIREIMGTVRIDL